MHPMKKATTMADPQPHDGTVLSLWASLALSLLGNIGAVAKYLIDSRTIQTKADAERVDAAHSQQVATLMDRVDDTETRLNEMTAAHRECEKNHATLSGRVGALEAQAAECFEDRKILRDELAAMRKMGS